MSHEQRSGCSCQMSIPATKLCSSFYNMQFLKLQSTCWTAPLVEKGTKSFFLNLCVYIMKSRSEQSENPFLLCLLSVLWIHLSMLSRLGMQNDHSSDLFWASSITLSLITWNSWRSLCVNHKPVLSFSEKYNYSKCRIITLCHWLFLCEFPHFYKLKLKLRESGSRASLISVS